MKTNRFHGFFGFILIIIAIIEIVFILCLAFKKAELNMYPREYYSIVQTSCEEYGLSESLVLAIIKTESSFRYDAVSYAGAIGLMQLMPDTYIWFANRLGNYEAQESDLYDPEKNIYYGCAYFSYLYEKFGNLETAIAAYNAGPGRVSEWLSDIRYSADGVTLYYIPNAETSDYVEKVTERAQKYRQIYNIE